MIRLYKHAAYMTASDQEALDELYETERGRLVLGPRLAEAAAWVDPHRVQALREGLRQAGYVARVSADSEPPKGAEG